jgi:hypothetical protein
MIRVIREGDVARLSASAISSMREPAVGPEEAVAGRSRGTAAQRVNLDMHT